jgi:hypothetical protein
LALVAALAVCLSGLPAAPAVAATLSAQTSADRARVAGAVARFEATRRKATTASARARRAAAELDRTIAAQEQARARLETFAVEMYRADDDAYMTLLFGAESIEEFTTVWEFMARMSEQEADELRALETARAAAERSARALMALQAEEVQALDATTREVAVTRRALAKSAAALKAYEERIAAARKAEALKRRPAPPAPPTTSTGAWDTGLASHYSWNFTGRGASARGSRRTR